MAVRRRSLPRHHKAMIFQCLALVIIVYSAKKALKNTVNLIVVPKIA